MHLEALQQLKDQLLDSFIDKYEDLQRLFAEKGQAAIITPDDTTYLKYQSRKVRMKGDPVNEKTGLPLEENTQAKRFSNN